MSTSRSGSSRVEGSEVNLTPHQFDILRVLARNQGKLVTHRALLREVWGPGYGSESNLLHVHVSQLRRRIEPDPTRPRYLITAPGAGYRLVDPTRPEPGRHRLGSPGRLQGSSGSPAKPSGALRARLPSLEAWLTSWRLQSPLACFAFAFVLLFALERV